MGRIGEAFGMQMLFTNSKTTKEELYAKAAEADFISLHCPAKAENRHMVNAEFLANLKAGAILINTARGALIDEPAVIDALDSGHLAWFCADVLEKEPPAPDNKLMVHPKAIITPHIAWASLEARERLAGVTYENFAAFLRGEPQNNVAK